jgi:hypothetical protein
MFLFYKFKQAILTGAHRPPPGESLGFVNSADNNTIAKMMRFHNILCGANSIDVANESCRSGNTVPSDFPCTRFRVP